MENCSALPSEGDDGDTRGSDAQDGGAQDSDATQSWDEPIKIQTYVKKIKCNAIWKDANGTAKCLKGLDLLIDVNTKTAKTAIFRLSVGLFLKHPIKNNRQNVYLYICASDIHTITFEIDDDSIPSLHFSLARNSSLVGPNEYPLAVKKTYKESLGSVLDLALKRDFTIRLNESTPNESTLRKIVSIFSSKTTDRPNNNLELNDLKSLYNGNGGEVINLCQEALPSYEAPKRHKRKRSSNTEDEVTQPEKCLKALLEDYFAKIDRRFDTIEGRLDKTDGGLNKLEGCFSDMRGRFGRITGRLDNMEECLNNVRQDISNLRKDISNVRDDIVDLDVKTEVANEVASQLEDSLREYKDEIEVSVAAKIYVFEDDHEKDRAQQRQDTDEYHEKLKQDVCDDVDRQLDEHWGKQQEGIKLLVADEVKKSIPRVRLTVDD